MIFFVKKSKQEIDKMDNIELATAQTRMEAAIDEATQQHARWATLDARDLSAQSRLAIAEILCARFPGRVSHYWWTPPGSDPSPCIPVNIAAFNPHPNVFVVTL